MATTTYEKEFEKAFLIDEKIFRRICELIEKHEGQIVCTAWFSDDAKIEALTMDEVLALPNSKGRQIVHLEIETSYRCPLRVDLNLRNDTHLAPVSYRVVGDDKDATYVSGELEKLLKETFQSYSILTVIRPPHFVLGGAIQMVGFGLLGYAIDRRNIGLGVVAIFIVVGIYLYSRTVHWLMPPGIFALGDGAERAAQLKGRRLQAVSILLVALGLGFFVNFASAWIFDKIFRK